MLHAQHESPRHTQRVAGLDENDPPSYIDGVRRQLWGLLLHITDINIQTTIPDFCSTPKRRLHIWGLCPAIPLPIEWHQDGEPKTQRQCTYIGHPTSTHARQLNRIFSQLAQIVISGGGGGGLPSKCSPHAKLSRWDRAVFARLCLAPPKDGIIDRVRTPRTRLET